MRSDPKYQWFNGEDKSDFLYRGACLEQSDLVFNWVKQTCMEAKSIIYKGTVRQYPIDLPIFSLTKYGFRLTIQAYGTNIQRQEVSSQSCSTIIGLATHTGLASTLTLQVLSCFNILKVNVIKHSRLYLCLISQIP